MKLDLQQRHDAAVSQGITAAVLSFLNHLEDIAGDAAAMERLERLGLLIQQENLLSSNAKDKGMTEDQLAVTLALQLVSFRVVSFSGTSSSMTTTRLDSTSTKRSDDEPEPDEYSGETEFTGLHLTHEERRRNRALRDRIALSRSTSPIHVKVTSKRANPYKEARADGQEVVLALLDGGQTRTNGVDTHASSKEASEDGSRDHYPSHASEQTDKNAGECGSNDSQERASEHHDHEAEPANVLLGMNLDDQLAYEETAARAVSNSRSSHLSARTAETPTSTSSSSHTGWLWKEAASGRMFGFASKHWDKRWMVLRRGRLTWYTNRLAVHPQNSMLLDGYRLRKVGQVQSWIQFELHHPDTKRRVLRLRAKDKTKCHEWIENLQMSIENFTKCPIHFRFSFAGYKFLGGDDENDDSVRAHDCFVHSTPRSFDSSFIRLTDPSSTCRALSTYSSRPTTISVSNLFVGSSWTSPCPPTSFVDSLPVYEADLSSVSDRSSLRRVSTPASACSMRSRTSHRHERPSIYWVSSFCGPSLMSTSRFPRSSTPRNGRSTQWRRF